MANTKVTGNLIASSTIATDNIADNAVTSDKISGITTAHIAEGTNLYYTDARADARAALLVDSAPSTLNTLNELAAALGDDPNFATTVTNSIGTKLPLAGGTLTGGLTGTTAGFSGSITASGNSNSFGNTTIGALAASTGTFSASVTAAGNSNSFGNSTFAGNVTVNARGFFNSGGSYPLATSSTQRYNIQIRNTNNTVNSGYGWWWGTDTNFNMFFHADGASDRMTLTRLGELGVNWTSPGAYGQLTVNGSSALPILALRSTSGKVRQGFYEGGTGRFYFDTLGDDGLAFIDGDGLSTRMLIDSAGKVGINKTDPAFKTHIRGGSGTEETVLKIDKSSAADSGGHMTIVGLGCESAGWAKAGIGFERTGAYDTGKMHFLMYPTGLNTNSVGLSNSVMTINNDGNIMMGKTSQSGNAALTIKSTAGGNTGIILIEGDTANNGWGMYARTADDYRITRFTNGSYSDKFIIESNGKVGIGAAPTEMLHINGGGSGPEVRLQGTWGSHYIRAYNDNWNFLVGGTVQAINIKNNGNVQMGTTNNGSKLNVGGTIAAATNDLSSGMVVPRSYGINWGGATFTHTFNPVALFGNDYRGGQVLLECTGWQMAMNNGYIMWRNAGGGDPIGTNGSVSYVQTAYNNGGQSGSNTIAVSLTTGTNNITITFTGWHGNSHGFMCRLTTNYS